MKFHHALFILLLGIVSIPMFSRAQFDGAYDPFADYSEFSDASEEEADVNFFRNGRFFSVALALGTRRFTGTMGELYKPAFGFGAYLTYFFDLRFALQAGFITSDHPFTLSINSQDVTGKITLGGTSFHIKYYINTQNVTKGLSTLNPYLMTGFSQLTRTTRVSGVTGFGRDKASSFDLGLGIEIPLMKHKMYLGAQALFQLANFPDENTQLTIPNPGGGTSTSTLIPKGDPISLNLLLGINF